MNVLKIKIAVIAGLTLLSTLAHAESAEDISTDWSKSGGHEYLGRVFDADSARAFYSPCDKKNLNEEIEIAEAKMYVRQGFKLVAKIRIPQSDPKHLVPECAYLFVHSYSLVK